MLVVLAVELVPEEGVEELKVENKLSKDLELALEPRPGWRLILFKLPRIPASDLISEVILEAIWRLRRLLEAVLGAVLEAVEVFLPVELFAINFTFKIKKKCIKIHVYQPQILLVRSYLRPFVGLNDYWMLF